MSQEGHHHHHGTGIKWVDLTVAISAIFISVVSLLVSIAHGRTMEKLVDQSQRIVAAETMPILQYGYNIAAPGTGRQFGIAIKNGGVGPAIVKWLAISYAGRPVAGPKQLLDACCAASLSGKPLVGANYTDFINYAIDPKETGLPIQISGPQNAALVKQLADQAGAITARACYCSVLKECWLTAFDDREPMPVAHCPTVPRSRMW